MSGPDAIEVFRTFRNGFFFVAMVGLALVSIGAVKAMAESKTKWHRKMASCLILLTLLSGVTSLVFFGLYERQVNAIYINWVKDNLPELSRFVLKEMTSYEAKSKYSPASHPLTFSGKIVILEQRGNTDDISVTDFYGVNPALKATNPSEIGTVILIRVEQKTTPSSYVRLQGNTQTRLYHSYDEWEVYLIDKRSGKVLCVDFNFGKEPESRSNEDDFVKLINAIGAGGY